VSSVSQVQRREDDAVAVLVHGLPAVTPVWGHDPPGAASDAPLSPEDETRTGRPGAATLGRVGDLKARAASADHERRERLNQRLRQAFLEEAEEDSRRRLGRGLTAEELERILWHYPGDVVERRER
jgi:hypothetical protein